MKKLLENRLLSHVLFWIILIFFFFIIEIPNKYKSPEDWQYSFFYNFPSALVYSYFILLVLIPQFLLKKKYFLFALSFVVWVVVSGLIRVSFLAFYEYVIAPKLFHVNHIGETKFSWDFYNDFIFGGSFFQVNMIAGLACGVKLFKYWFNKQQQQQQLNQERLQYELQLLKAQLQPHFLFNTLNNLYSLTLQKSRQSPEVVLKLSHLLSYMLYESQAEIVPLEKELEMLKNYVALEQIRTQGEWDVSLNIVGEIKDKKIAPLLLFPFIENAFNYNFDKKEEVIWISLDVLVSSDFLKFKLIHSRNENEEINYTENTSIRNIKKRLNLLYPNHFELKITLEDNIIINLNLQLTENEVLELT